MPQRHANGACEQNHPNRVSSANDHGRVDTERILMMLRRGRGRLVKRNPFRRLRYPE